MPVFSLALFDALIGVACACT